MKLLSGNSNKPLSKNIAKYLKSKLVNSSIRNFSDGEIYVEINENIRGNNIFLVQSFSLWGPLKCGGPGHVHTWPAPKLGPGPT